MPYDHDAHVPYDDPAEESSELNPDYSDTPEPLASIIEIDPPVVDLNIESEDVFKYNDQEADDDVEEET
jgi:hypothetical protein